MEIRTGTLEDLPIIMEIVNKAIAIMHEEGNDQWCDVYPNEKDFRNDIANQSLFVAVNEDNRPIGAVTIDQIGGESYKDINWTYPDKEYMVIHRLMVDPDIRGGGIASKLLTFAEIYAIEHDIFYLKTDTYSLNDKAQNLFVKNGYNKVGHMHQLEKDYPFYCYDKLFL